MVDQDTEIPTTNELSNALKEVKLALDGLKGKKQEMQKQIGGLELQLRATQANEIQLKAQLGELTQKEQEFLLERAKIKEEIEKMENRITKYAQIEAEMEETR